MEVLRKYESAKKKKYVKNTWTPAQATYTVGLERVFAAHFAAQS